MSPNCVFTKCPKVLAFVLCVASWSSGQATSLYANSSDPLLTLDEDHLLRGRFLGVKAGRKPRFLSFQTTDNDISVEMQLSVPFLSIPVKKTIDSTAGFFGNLPTANINLGALGLAGVVVLGSIFVLPNLAKLMSVDHFSKESGYKRSVDDLQHPVLLQLFRALSEHGVPADICAQRAVCALVRKSREAANPTSSDKIVDGIASNEWLLNYLKGTILSEAIASGYSKSGESCKARFPRCQINQAALHNVARIISKNIFSNE